MKLSDALNSFEARIDASPTLRDILSWTEYVELRKAMILEHRELIRLTQRCVEMEPRECPKPHE